MSSTLPPSGASEFKPDLKKIEQQLVQANPNLFKGIPGHKKKALLQFLAIQVTSHSGPIPDPENLARYNEIIPKGADRIMTMAEKQQDHRIALEKKVVGRQTFQSGVGQLFGLLIGLAAIFTGGYCILQGHEWAGSFLGGAGLTGLVSVFVIGKRTHKQSLQQKNN